MEVLAVIPARSGSKTVVNKNIRKIMGKPLMAYSIEHALNAKLINRVIVSTDSDEYAQIAREYGAEVPFLRPAELAQDRSLDIEAFEHVLKELEVREGYIPDIVVQLRPTYPIRNTDDIDNMIRILQENPTADSVRCIAPAKEIAYKMWRKNEDGSISPLLNDIEEAYNMPRQALPVIYYQNACIDVVRASVITNEHSMTGRNIVGYEMKDNFDIDTEADFLAAEQYLKFINGKNDFVIDIDGVVACFREDLNYANCTPNQKMVDIINRLYDRGNHIVLFTARGYKTGIDWREVTEQQLTQWGVKYHELKFGKPNADFYIDDKMLGIEELYDFISKEGK